jgi:hypothetical protein
VLLRILIVSKDVYLLYTRQTRLTILIFHVCFSMCGFVLCRCVSTTHILVGFDGCSSDSFLFILFLNNYRYPNFGMPWTNGFGCFSFHCFFFSLMRLVLRLAFIFAACWRIFDFSMIILLGISLPLALIYHNYVYFFFFLSRLYPFLFFIFF